MSGQSACVTSLRPEITAIIAAKIVLSYQGDVTTITLKPHEADEIEAIQNDLDVEGRTVHLDPKTNKLTIDSSNCPTYE